MLPYQRKPVFALTPAHRPRPGWHSFGLMATKEIEYCFLLTLPGVIEVNGTKTHTLICCAELMSVGYRCFSVNQRSGAGHHQAVPCFDRKRYWTGHFARVEVGVLTAGLSSDPLPTAIADCA